MGDGGLAAAVAALNLWLTLFMWGYGESYVYWMGHFPAPWGNELRAGVLEPTLAVVFSLIMLLSVLGGMRKLTEQVDRKKVNIVCVMLDLVLAAMMSMLYTNDLFTAYVFIEIMTLTACALIMSRPERPHDGLGHALHDYEPAGLRPDPDRHHHHLQPHRPPAHGKHP